MGLYIPTNKVIFLKKYIYFSFACLFTINLFSQSLNPNFFTNNINENELKNLIYVYSSDFFKGSGEVLNAGKEKVTDAVGYGIDTVSDLKRKVEGR